MSAVLLISLAMVNAPVYRLFGRLFFARGEQFAEALQLWASLELLRNPGSATTDALSADVRLALLIGACAAIVLAEFVLLAEFVFRIVL